MAKYEEVYEKSLNYFNGDELASKVFADKYALMDNDGDYKELTPDDMHRRLAKEFARIEKKYPNPMSENEIYELFKNFKYVVPQGSPSSAIGNDYQIQSAGNCFVVPPVVDSYGGILFTDQQLVQLSKRRAGVGLDISNLRPKGMITKNAAKTTDGIAVFMERFSNSIREVAQCIAKGEKVLTKRGLIPIEQVIPNKDLVWTKVGWVDVLEVKNNGKKEIFETTTDFGYSIRTTEEHIFVNENMEEIKLKDFEINDTILLMPGTIKDVKKEYVPLKKFVLWENYGSRLNLDIIFPETLNEDLAYLLGYSYGDGSVEKDKFNQPDVMELSCSNDYPAIKEKLKLICKNVFGYEINSRPGDGDLERLSISSKVILAFLEQNEILKSNGVTQTFPELISSSPYSVQLSFIAGYFDADGYASGRKKGYVFSSVNKLFLNNVQNILMSVGVVSKFHLEDRTKLGWNNLYSLCVIGSYAKNYFKQIIEKYSFKINDLNHIGIKDSVLTPFKIGMFGIKRKNFIPDKAHYISCNAYKRYLDEFGRDATPNMI